MTNLNKHILSVEVKELDRRTMQAFKLVGEDMEKVMMAFESVCKAFDTRLGLIEERLGIEVKVDLPEGPATEEPV